MKVRTQESPERAAQFGVRTPEGLKGHSRSPTASAPARLTSGAVRKPLRVKERQNLATGGTDFQAEERPALLK